MSDQPTQSIPLLIFFKALSDSTRLKIVGLLASSPYTVEQLSVILSLGASTVSHHLSRLAEVGLVSAQAEGYYSVYHLEAGALEEMARQLLSRDSLPALAEDLDLQAFDRKVLRDYTLPDGSFKTIPSQRKKLVALLRHVVLDFEVDRRYSEKEVNQILKRYHEDTATLRRELIGYTLMARQNGEYWRI
jgi:hypothetical protein